MKFRPWRPQVSLLKAVKGGLDSLSEEVLRLQRIKAVEQTGSSMVRSRVPSLTGAPPRTAKYRA